MIKRTKYDHYLGGLGNYNGNPTAVGGLRNNYVETLTEDGWKSLPSHPLEKITSMCLVGLSSGSLLSVGGYGENAYGSFLDSIWQLSKNKWSLLGRLKGVAIKNLISRIKIFSGGVKSISSSDRRVNLYFF